MMTTPLYQRLATHYRSAIHTGILRPGDKMPSLRTLMRQHSVSLSTATQLNQLLESEGLLEARPRSGYFVCTPVQTFHPIFAPASEPNLKLTDTAQYVGIHAKVSNILALGRLLPAKINLSVARCAPSLYPAQALQQAAMRHLRQDPALLVTASTPKGNPSFRTAIAKRALHASMRLTAEDIQVTQGCTEALSLALRAIAEPGDTIAVESPTFYGLLQILESFGLKALEIPTSPKSGISCEAVELALQSHNNIKAVVVVPQLQNPLGCCMPDANKVRLLQLCQQHDVALIEDDSYSALLDEAVQDNSNMSLRAIKSWDETGHVIHCASLHKHLAPGLRLGWISAGRWQARVEMLKYAYTRCNENLPQLAAAEFINSAAYDRHLRRLRSHLANQRTQTVQAIARYFPPDTRLTVPKAGLSLWLELPQGISATDLFHAALKEQIVISPGTLFSNSSHFDRYLRINCGWPYTAEIDNAFETLGRIAVKNRIVTRRTPVTPTPAAEKARPVSG